MLYFIGRDYLSMANPEDLVVLPLDGAGQGQIQHFTLSDADIATSVQYGQLKPIIMTMANMANVSEEVQVLRGLGILKCSLPSTLVYCYDPMKSIPMTQTRGVC